MLSFKDERKIKRGLAIAETIYLIVFFGVIVTVIVLNIL